MVGLKRVFAAVALPDEVRLALAERLAPLPMPGKVVPAPNWHVTLRFLGTVDQVTHERFLGALEGLGAAFRLALGELGAFPRPARATVLWAAVTRGVDRLEELAHLCEEAAQDAGLPGEERPFRPHLTLSRIRPPVDVTGLVADFEPLALSWRCDAVTVYESRQGSAGVGYEPLEILPLTR